MEEQKVSREENETVQVQKSFGPIILTMVLTTLVVGSIIFFWQNSERSSEESEFRMQKKELESKNLILQEQIDKLKKMSKQNQTVIEEEKVQETKKTGSKIVSIDEIWNQYINYDLGFKIKYPKMNNKKPVEIIESGSVVYVLDNYDSSRIENQKNLVSEFEKAKGISFAYIVKDAKNDDEISEFLRNKYGENCGFFEKKKTKKEGIFDIVIKNIGSLKNPSRDPSSCAVEGARFIKYFPEKEKIVSWDWSGQDCTFFEDSSLRNCLVSEMNDSFEFIN